MNTHIDSRFVELKINKPQCPCCGAALPEPKLLVDLESNMMTYKKTMWYLNPQLAVFAWVLIDAWPKMVSKSTLDFKMYGIMDGPESDRGNYPTYACVLRKIVRKIGGDILHIPKRGYQIVLPKR